MLGLAQMAWRLALKRTYRDADLLSLAALSERSACWNCWIDAMTPGRPLASNEYYRIIDRITRGQEP